MYKAKRFKPESYVSNVLARELNGDREVKTPVGNIDVLTNTELIEVKKLNQWKSALGQLVAYGVFYPSHSLRLHIIGMPDSDLESHIKKACKKIGASLSFQSEVEYSKQELAEQEARTVRAVETIDAIFTAFHDARRKQLTEREDAIMRRLDNIEQMAKELNL